MCTANLQLGHEIGERGGRYAYQCPAGDRFTNGNIDEIVLVFLRSGQTSLAETDIQTYRVNLRMRCTCTREDTGPNRKLGTCNSNKVGPAQTKTDLKAGVKAGYLLLSRNLYSLAPRVIADLRNNRPGQRCNGIAVIRSTSQGIPSKARGTPAKAPGTPAKAQGTSAKARGTSAPRQRPKSIR